MSYIKDVTCPKCKHETLVYNGNYYCDNDFLACGWAMDDKDTKANRNIMRVYMTQEHDKAIVDGNPERLRRMDFYLNGMGDD